MDGYSISYNNSCDSSSPERLSNHCNGDCLICKSFHMDNLFRKEYKQKNISFCSRNWDNRNSTDYKLEHSRKSRNNQSLNDLNGIKSWDGFIYWREEYDNQAEMIPYYRRSKL